MKEAFLNLDQEKRHKILNAAMKEFGEHGFEAASTNRMVKEAGIGKGMLFYYFGNKKTLYYELIKYALELNLTDFIDRIDMEERDFIERFYQTAKLKLQLFNKHPNIIAFLTTFFLTDHEDAPQEIVTLYQKLESEGFRKMYENIDRTLFKAGIDVEKAFQLIQWSMEGYQNDLKTRLHNKKFTEIDLEYYWDEFYQYLAVLKAAYYH